MRASNPTSRTIRALFAKSGNKCAFPGCRAQLIGKNDLFIAQICHIEAASADGPRFNPMMTDAARRATRNLILLCYPHHREVDDDLKKYSVTLLQGMKKHHEQGVKTFRIREAALHRIALEIEKYWQEVDAAKTSHPAPEFAIPIDPTLDGLSLFRMLEEKIASAKQLANNAAESDERLKTEVPAFIKMLSESGKKYGDIPYHENPFENRNWELHALGTTNVFATITVYLEQLETKFLEHYLQLHPNDSKAKARFKIARTALKNSASQAGFAD